METHPDPLTHTVEHLATRSPILLLSPLSHAPLVPGQSFIDRTVFAVPSPLSQSPPDSAVLDQGDLPRYPLWVQLRLYPTRATLACATYRRVRVVGGQYDFACCRVGATLARRVTSGTGNEQSLPRLGRYIGQRVGGVGGAIASLAHLLFSSCLG